MTGTPCSCTNDISPIYIFIFGSKKIIPPTVGKLDEGPRDLRRTDGVCVSTWKPRGQTILIFESKTNKSQTTSCTFSQQSVVPKSSPLSPRSSCAKAYPPGHPNRSNPCRFACRMNLWVFWGVASGKSAKIVARNKPHGLKVRVNIGMQYTMVEHSLWSQTGNPCKTTPRQKSSHGTKLSKGNMWRVKTFQCRSI